MNYKQIEDRHRWMFGQRLIEPCETLDVETALSADPKMLMNMCKRSVELVDITLVILLSGE